MSKGKSSKHKRLSQKYPIECHKKITEQFFMIGSLNIKT